MIGSVYMGSRKIKGLRICRWKPAKQMLAVGVLIGIVLVMGNRAVAGGPADFMVKISQLERALDLIDPPGASDMEKAPAAGLRDTLKGVDWIDDERSLVLWWVKYGEHPFYAVLVPYSRVNSDFKASHKALSRDDYYLLSLPPGRADAIPEHFEMEMAKASRKVSAATVSLRLAPHRLIEGIRDKSGTRPQTVGQKGPQDRIFPLLPTAENIRQTTAGFKKAAEQVDSLSVSVDVDENRLKIVSEMLPVRSSKLSALLASSGLTTRLDDYRPVHATTFRTRSFDVAAALDLLGTFLDPGHGKSGISFAELKAMGRYFTGEAAGGMTHANAEENRVWVECMAVLKNEVNPANFMEDVFLPWAEVNGGDIAGFMEIPSGGRAGSVVMRTQGSKVAGYTVAGLRVELPAAPLSAEKSRPGNEDKVITYDFRLAVVGNLLLVAPDDGRMKTMILTVEHLRKKTAHGPMLTMTADRRKYLSSLVHFISGHGIGPQPFQHIGTGPWVVTAGQDRIISSVAVETGDVHLVLAALNRMQTEKGRGRHASNIGEQKPASSIRASKPVTVPMEHASVSASQADKPVSESAEQSLASAPEAIELEPVPAEQSLASAPYAIEPEPVPEKQSLASVPEAIEPEPMPAEQAFASAPEAAEKGTAPIEQATALAPNAHKPVSIPIERAPVSAPKTDKTVPTPVDHVPAAAAKSNKPVSKPVKQAPAPAPKLAKPTKKTVQPVVRDAGYWMEKGRLAAAYGAYESAIRHYLKAQAMGMEDGRVFFNTGIAYGELGDYSQALEYLQRAIQMDPGQGAYYYGRARVHLLSGNKERAREDFNRAADLGDLDAMQYLERAGRLPN